MPRALYLFFTVVLLLQTINTAFHGEFQANSNYNDNNPEFSFLNTTESTGFSMGTVDLSSPPLSGQSRKLRLKRRPYEFDIEPEWKVQAPPSPEMKILSKRRPENYEIKKFEDDSSEEFLTKRNRLRKGITSDSEEEDEDESEGEVFSAPTRAELKEYPRAFRSEDKRIWDASAVRRAFSKESPDSIQLSGSPLVEESRSSSMLSKSSSPFDYKQNFESKNPLPFLIDPSPITTTTTATTTTMTSPSEPKIYHPRAVGSGIIRSSPHYNLAELSPQPISSRFIPLSTFSTSDAEAEDTDDEVAKLTQDMSDFGFFVSDLEKLEFDRK